jgi:hypothetical protein
MNPYQVLGGETSSGSYAQKAVDTFFASCCTVYSGLKISVVIKLKLYSDMLPSTTGQPVRGLSQVPIASEDNVCFKHCHAYFDFPLLHPLVPLSELETQPLCFGVLPLQVCQT